MSVQKSLVLRVVELLKQKNNTYLPVNELASILGVSRSHLQHAFRTFTGLTVANYQKQVRLAASVSQIAETNKRIIDIALDSGFESQESYIRAFKKYFGITPKHLRQAPERATFYKSWAYNIDESYLNFVEWINTNPPKLAKFPVKRLHTRFTALPSPNVDGQTFHAKFDQLWRELKEVLHKEHLKPSRYYTVEMLSHFSGSNAHFLLAAGIDADEGELVNQSMTQISLSDNWVYEFSLPSGDHVPGFYCYLYNVFLPENQLHQASYPVIWEYDAKSDTQRGFLHLCEVDECKRPKAIKSIGKTLCTQELPDHVESEQIIPDSILGRVERLSWLGNDEKFSQTDDYPVLVLGQGDVEYYRPEHDAVFRFVSTEQLNNKSTHQSEFLEVVFLGTLREIGEAWEYMHLVYAPYSDHYFVPGCEWITNRQLFEDNQWRFTVLIPARKR